MSLKPEPRDHEQANRDEAGRYAADDLRRITDARTLRALAHPVRIAVMEALTLGGAMTATEVGERIGESPTTCSFHLRQLAKYGFVEEAGGGKGRARPWRMTSIGFSIAARDDPQSEIAANALLSLVRERQLGRYQHWLETRGSYPRSWRDAADDSEYVFYLTVDELKQLNDDIAALLMPRLTERIANPAARPAGSVPVELLVFSYPMEPPAAGGSATDANGAASDSKEEDAE
jgi:DNA-binding transcriptional ArsR family regulator